MDDMTITKREILVSVAIVCIMILLGIVISGNINDAVLAKQQEYNTALQINKDKDLFEYGMETNVGNAFIYGDLKAVDTVTFPEIGGEYSYVRKVKERYTRHTRTVTKTRTVNGKSQTYTETEVYWTWDKVDEWDMHSKEITFLDVKFPYGTVDFPSSSHLKTIKESSKIRYQYYGIGTHFTGTVYGVLTENTLKKADFYNGRTIEETLEKVKTKWQLPVFWVCWTLLTGGLVFAFYYVDNHWLEDRRKNGGKIYDTNY